jgi:hypothetical protein
MKQQLREADWVLMFFDDTYARRFDGDEEPNKGLGATWEGAIITNQYYADGTINERFIPLLVDGPHTVSIPHEWNSYNHYHIPSQTADLTDKLRRADGDAPSSRTMVPSVHETSESPDSALADSLKLSAMPEGQLILEARDCLAVKNYVRCDRVLEILRDRNPRSSQVLWLFHVARFERACAEKNENHAEAYKKESMQYYREATTLDPSLKLFSGDAYKVVEPIGYGGFSRVYLAKKDGQEYAAKCIRPELVANTVMLRKHLANLQQIKSMTESAATISGIGIARIVDFFPNSPLKNTS